MELPINEAAGANTPRKSSISSKAYRAITLFRLLATAGSLAWRAHWFAVLCTSILTIFTGALPVLIALLTKLFIDEISGPEIDLSGPDSHLLAIAGIGLVLSLALLQVCAPIHGYFDRQLRRQIELLAEDQLFSHLNTIHGLAAFERPELHDKLQVAQQGGQFAPAQVLAVGTYLTQSAITVSGFLVALLLIDPALALLGPMPRSLSRSCC